MILFFHLHHRMITEHRQLGLTMMWSLTSRMNMSTPAIEFVKKLRPSMMVSYSQVVFVTLSPWCLRIIPYWYNLTGGRRFDVGKTIMCIIIKQSKYLLSHECYIIPYMNTLTHNNTFTLKVTKFDYTIIRIKLHEYSKYILCHSSEFCSQKHSVIV